MAAPMSSWVNRDKNVIVSDHLWEINGGNTSSVRFVSSKKSEIELNQKVIQK